MYSSFIAHKASKGVGIEYNLGLEIFWPEIFISSAMLITITGMS